MEQASCSTRFPRGVKGANTRDSDEMIDTKINLMQKMRALSLIPYPFPMQGKGQGKSSSSAGADAPATSASAEALSSHEALKKKKAWEFAISPLKSLPMQAFMLYMSGGGVQIFSMGIVAMLLLSPFKNLSTVNTGASSHFIYFIHATKPLLNYTSLHFSRF